MRTALLIRPLSCPGYVVRKKLAKALRLEGAVLGAVVELMTGELDEETGRLKVLQPWVLHGYYMGTI